MSNYFRLTAYNEKENISVIMDSNGKFEKLWQFSSFVISKGFKIIEISNDDKFLDINIDKAEVDLNKMILRASCSGKPIEISKTINGVSYKAIQVADKIYIPDKTQII